MFKNMRVFVLLLAWPLTLSVAGCDCDAGRGDLDAGPLEMGIPHPCNGTDGTVISCDPSLGSCCVLSTGAPTCVPTVQPSQCYPPFDCAEVDPPTAANNCAYTAPLQLGQMATHLDIAAAADGAVFVTGYSPGIVSSKSYGDLVVGRVQGAEVIWSIVDGVPGDAVVMPDPTSNITPLTSGWRGGITEPGDNVGEFNSVAVSPSGDAVSISYYDRTNQDLKFASSTDGGTTWSVHTVFSAGDSGRYTSLAYMLDGRPAIAFMSMTPTALIDVRPVSQIRVAVATVPRPASMGDWELFPEMDDPARPATAMPCSAALCAGGLVCRADDGTCAIESTDADTDCSHVDRDGETQAGCDRATRCLRSPDDDYACAAIRGPNFIDEAPEADGLYTSLRATGSGLALVWHNRVRRTLMGDTFDSSAGTWRELGPFPIDGFDAVGMGDAGYNADLFIDAAGNWHIAYVEGAYEQLRHAQIDGTTLGTPSPTMVRGVVDDGTRPPRDRAIVGSDADIAVLTSGEVRIVYQNSTHLEALVATRAAGEMGWLLQGGNAGAPLDEANATGYWTCQALAGDTSHVATWWIDTTEAGAGRNGTRVFTIP